MPIYEYYCKKCGYEFEEMQLIANRKKPTKRACSECGEKQIEQKVSKMNIDYSGKPLTSRLDNGFKDVLSRVSDASGKENTIDTGRSAYRRKR